MFLYIAPCLLFALTTALPQSDINIDRSVNSTNDTGRKCYDVKVPVTVTSENYIWGLSEFENNFDVGNFVTELVRRDADTSFNPFSGISGPETANYTIAGSFCTPQDGIVNTVMVASHGLLMDR